MFAAVTDDHDVDVPKRGAAVGAVGDVVEQARWLLDLARVPVWPLDRPRDDMLEAAERGPACARNLLGAPAVLALDRIPAPGATLGRLLRHGGG